MFCLKARFVSYETPAFAARSTGEKLAIMTDRDTPALFPRRCNDSFKFDGGSNRLSACLYQI
jgi:hypothetical protein